MSLSPSALKEEKSAKSPTPLSGPKESKKKLGVEGGKVLRLLPLRRKKASLRETKREPLLPTPEDEGEREKSGRLASSSIGLSRDGGRGA